jgi:hypothetical protein
MKWNDYLEELLDFRYEFDDLQIAFDDTREEFNIPNIIKSTVLLVDKNIDAGMNRNIVIFPERKYSSLLYALIKVSQNIIVGKINTSYNLNNFVKGQKLRYKKGIVEFDSIETKDGITRINVKLSDLDSLQLPLAIAPFFQLAETKQLSSYKTFTKSYKASEFVKNNDGIINVLKNYKTHLDSSIFYMGRLKATRKKLTNWSFNSNKVIDTLLIGEVNYKGVITNIGKGQLVGVPSIVLAPDLYAINEAVKKGAPIQSVIIDASRENSIGNQLDVINDLLQIDIPITLVTDKANSFSLDPLTSRGFKTWRWEREYIHRSFYESSRLEIEKKSKNLVNIDIQFSVIDDLRISAIFDQLYSHRKEAKNQSNIEEIFSELMRLAIRLVRTIVPLHVTEIQTFKQVLAKSSEGLEKVQHFISSDLFEGFSSVISSLNAIICSFEPPPKINKMEKLFLDETYKTINVVIDNRSDKVYVENYWSAWFQNNDSSTKVVFYTAKEYLSNEVSLLKETSDSLTVISGWFSKEVLQNILYSFINDKYLVLLYKCEDKWRRSHMYSWQKIISESNNNEIIQTIDHSQKIMLPQSSGGFQNNVSTNRKEHDIVDDLDLVLRDFSYSQYRVSDDEKDTGNVVQAIPISFVGDYISFFRESRKVVTVTNIIVSDNKKEEIKVASQLKIGDFIVLRESDRDIIRDLADIILKKSNLEHLRGVATSWRTALENHSHYRYRNLMIKKLRDAGCTRKEQTIIGWLYDENMISPQEKKDLKYIAKAMKNKELDQTIDEVHEAARTVTRAHVQAGRHLSKLLKSNIGDAVEHLIDIDHDIINEPIDLNLKDIGSVKVLKIIDIGEPINVDVINTNRLIQER